MKIRKDGVLEGNSESVASFSTGAKSSVGTSAVQMTSSSVKAPLGVTVKAANNNSGTVYVGSSSSVTAGTADSTDGFELGPGESITILVDNTNKVWLIGSAAGQKVFYMVN